MINGKIANNTVEGLETKEVVFEKSELEVKEEEMPRRRKKPTRKRIRNPKTGRYYQIRQRSSSKGRRGTIMGTWSPPAKKRKKRK